MGLQTPNMQQGAHGDWSWQVAADHSLTHIQDRRRTLDHDTDQLRSTVRAGIENLRRALDEREAQLLSGVEDVYANNRKVLDECETHIAQLRSRLAESAGNAVVPATNYTTGASSSYAPMSHSLPPTVPHGNASPPSAYGGGSASRMQQLPAASSAATGETVPNAIYVNGVPHDASEYDVRETFERFGEIKMINARHISTGGFAFVFFKQDIGAQIALENPRVVIKGKTANVLAKKQILGGRTSEI